MVRAFVIERVARNEFEQPAYFTPSGWLPPLTLPGAKEAVVPPSAATYAFASEAIEAIQQRAKMRDAMFPTDRQYRAKLVTIDDDGRTLPNLADTEYQLYGNRV